jgi:D-glycero-alpha-D-manno-heptose-7-phosphate kinase
MPGKGPIMPFARTIRARVPLRLDLAGSGTDLSPYCDIHGGAVLNTTIDRYAYAFIEPADDGQVHFIAPDLGLAEAVGPEIAALHSTALPLHAGVARRMVAEHGGGRVPPMRVTCYVDAPPGSGLGSSSALVVALVTAFAALYDAPLGPYDVARLAYEIERLDLRLPGGRQDQYAATFGGTNYIEFQGGDRVIVNPLRVEPAALNELEASLVICLSDPSRRTDAIIAEQQQRMTDLSETALAGLHQLKQDAVEMKMALLRGQIAGMAGIFNRSWLAKQRTASGVTTTALERVYDTALAHGALGGKLSGAGGGGALMFIVPPERRITAIRALRGIGANATGVHLTALGAESWLA